MNLSKNLDILSSAARLIWTVRDSIRFSITRKISWGQIDRAFQKLRGNIEGYRPDVIIGLADGGVAAGIIATNFGLCDGHHSCFSPYYTLGVAVGNENQIILLGKEFIPDLTGKRILLVDDHIYTGRTMEAAVTFLQNDRHTKEVQPIVFFAHEVNCTTAMQVWYAYKLRGRRIQVPWSYTKSHRAVFGT